jgi:hypothetical protein
MGAQIPKMTAAIDEWTGDFAQKQQSLPATSAFSGSNLENSA